MPIKGIILIFIIAIVCAVIERNNIYSWLTSVLSDDNYTDEDNFEEEQEE